MLPVSPRSLFILILEMPYIHYVQNFISFYSSSTHFYYVQNYVSVDSSNRWLPSQPIPEFLSLLEAGCLKIALFSMLKVTCFHYTQTGVPFHLGNVLLPLWEKLGLFRYYKWTVSIVFKTKFPLLLKVGYFHYG